MRVKSEERMMSQLASSWTAARRRLSGRQGRLSKADLRKYSSRETVLTPWML